MWASWLAVVACAGLACKKGSAPEDTSAASPRDAAQPAANATASSPRDAAGPSGSVLNQLGFAINMDWGACSTVADCAVLSSPCSDDIRPIGKDWLPTAAQRWKAVCGKRTPHEGPRKPTELLCTGGICTFPGIAGLTGLSAMSQSHPWPEPGTTMTARAHAGKGVDNETVAYLERAFDRLFPRVYRCYSREQQVFDLQVNLDSEGLVTDVSAMKMNDDEVSCLRQQLIGLPFAVSRAMSFRVEIRRRTP